MPSYKIIPIVILSFFITHSIRAQSADSIKSISAKTDTSKLKVKWQFAKAKNVISAKSLLIPGVLIAYGVTALENDGLKKFNTEISDEVYAENPHKKIPLDNYLQYAPAAMVYGLNIIGVKGRHNFRDRSMIYFMSNVILTGTVLSLKKITAVQRPDGSANNSFPSGHTAQAFASAEFLYQEYKDISPWYGIGGYAIAAATGYLRMYNNKHWLSDVVAGAGVGIVSTKIAYCLYPTIQRKLFKDKPVNTLIMPVYQQGAFGLSMVRKF
ncbi:MAG: Phosphoesterase [Segetibacter sp.]|nr:Phosphoesterase [Segetibacter sp.]